MREAWCDDTSVSPGRQSVSGRVFARARESREAGMYRGLVRGGWMREAWCDDTSVTRQGRWGTESPPQRCVRVIVFALSPPHTHSRPSYVVGCGGAVTGVACLAFPLLNREYVDGRSIGSSHRPVLLFAFTLWARA